MLRLLLLIFAFAVLTDELVAILLLVGMLLLIALVGALAEEVELELKLEEEEEEEEEEKEKELPSPPVAFSRRLLALDIFRLWASRSCCNCAANAARISNCWTFIAYWLFHCCKASFATLRKILMLTLFFSEKGK